MEDKVRSRVAKTVAYFFSSRERTAIFLYLHDWMWGLLFFNGEGASLGKPV